MAGLTTFRLRWMGMLRQFPSAELLEERRSALEADYQKYLEYGNGQEWKRFCELELYERSGQAKRVEEECRHTVYPGSPEEAKVKELRHLSKLKPVRLARKGKGDTSDPAYLRYLQLQEEVSSQQFRNRVAYLKDKRKYAKTEAAHAMQELKALRTSAAIKWYQATAKRPDIMRRMREEVVFFEDFNTPKLDPAKWLTRFPWADASIGKGYSCATDPHCYTEGANISIQNSCLLIQTRAERTQGLAWDDKLGFVTQQFDYTSGLLSTSDGFHFTEGLLEAKMRFSGAAGIIHSLYLRAGTTYPHIEVFRSATDGSHLTGGCYTNSPSQQESGYVGKLPYARDFFILSLRRERNSLGWAINGVPFHTQQEAVPAQPLHLIFASAVEAGQQPAEGACLEVDWIRCTITH